MFMIHKTGHRPIDIHALTFGDKRAVDFSREEVEQRLRALKCLESRRGKAGPQCWKLGRGICKL